MDAEQFLLKNNIGNIVINKLEYPENTPENAEKWIYVSDVMEGYLQAKELRSSNVETFDCAVISETEDQIDIIAYESYSTIHFSPMFHRVINDVTIEKTETGIKLSGTKESYNLIWDRKYINEEDIGTKYREEDVQHTWVLERPYVKGWYKELDKSTPYEIETTNYKLIRK